MSYKTLKYLLFSYGVAALAAILAVLLRIELEPIIGMRTLYLTIYPTIMLVSFGFGIGPGILCSVLGTSLIHILFHHDGFLWFISDKNEGYESLFVIITAIIGGYLSVYLKKRKIEFNQAILKSQRELKRAQAVAETGNWCLNIKDNKIEWSDETYNIFGIPPKTHLTYDSFIEMVVPEDREFVHDKWQSALRGETYDIEHRILANGQVKWVREKAEFDFDKQGRILVAFGTVQDVTTRKKTELELNESQKALREAKIAADAANSAKSRFLAMISHEIRTPLNAILGFSDLLLLESESESWTDHVQRIRQNGKHLSHLIGSILDLSKIEAGKIEAEHLEMNLNELLGDVSAAMRPKAAEKRISFGFMVEEPFPEEIVSDPLKFKQILLNIICNAIKFTEKGSVKVFSRADVKENILYFTVQDTGLGLSIEQQEKLFRPFEQADLSTSRKYGGTGLGLVLSRSLARLLGGDVILKNSEMGVGSTFEISLRFEQPKYKTRKIDVTSKKHELQRLDGLNILLAEDVLDNQLLTTRFLNLLGARVDLAENGEEAVKKALSQNYDIILMDVQMPHMDGCEATSLLRAKGYNKPIIALTAYSIKEELDKILAAGCNDFITKPVDQITISEKLKGLVH